MKILFVGAHPDDIEVGAGAVLLRRSPKNPLFYAVMADWDTGELREIRSVMKVVKPTRELRAHLRDRRLATTKSRERIRLLLEEARDFGCDVVYSPWVGDVHQDHAAVAEEVCRVFRQRTVYQYEIPYSCPGFAPDVYMEVTMGEMNRKCALVRRFKSQAHRQPMNIRAIQATAAFRGAQVGFAHAEAFKLWRMVSHAS